MRKLLKKGATVVMLGPGGVGKTTMAAALGLAAAQAALNTGVITIDPSRRLRDALGIDRLSARPAQLPAHRLRAAGLDPALCLSAMVLDVKRTWDGLVERFVTAPAARRRIFENSFYRSLTEQFAGAEAYAALEQLYELHRQQRFDFEVVDTPPAAHALEFIDAPLHLIRLLDSPSARWLFLPYMSASGSALGLAGRAARMVATQLESVAGMHTLKAVSDFFVAAASATTAISERFRKTHAMLFSPDVSFVLVTTCEEQRLDEAAELAARMAQEGLALGAIILNRICDERTFRALVSSPHEIPAHLQETELIRASIYRDNAPDPRIEAIVRYLDEHRSEQISAIARAARFANELPRHVNLVLMPEVEIGVRDLRGLARLSSLLAEAPAGRKVLADASSGFVRRNGRAGKRGRLAD